MKSQNSSYIPRGFDRGQSMTEFALSLVIILTLLAGIVDLGRAFFAYIIIRDAAQEGAVCGSIASKDNLAVFKNVLETRVKSVFTDLSDPSKVPLNISKLNGMSSQILLGPPVLLRGMEYEYALSTRFQ
jgi:hypothetical protein